MNTKWGIYPWFIEHGADLIHPSDFEAFKNEANNCKVFECIEGNDYIIPEDNFLEYRECNGRNRMNMIENLSVRMWKKAICVVYKLDGNKILRVWHNYAIIVSLRKEL